MKHTLYDYMWKRNHEITSQKPLKALQSSKIASTKLNDFTKAGPQTLNQNIICLINNGVKVVFALGMKSRWATLISFHCQILLTAFSVIPIIKYIIK